MQARNCRERILSLKQWRYEHGKTIDQCIEICGGYPSDTTISRIFGKGGEDKTFRESTIAAVELALTGKVYEPETPIPVELAVKAQVDTAKTYASEIRALEYQVKKQAHIINSLFALVVCCLVFFGSVALYDFLTHGTGFWNTDSSWVWFGKVAFLFCVAAVVLRLFFAIKKLKAEYKSVDD